MHSSKKINIAMIASNLELNGISAVIMNYVRYLDLNKFNITLIVGEKVDPNYQKICYSKNIKLHLVLRNINTKEQIGSFPKIAFPVKK